MYQSLVWWGDRTDDSNRDATVKREINIKIKQFPDLARTGNNNGYDIELKITEKDGNLVIVRLKIFICNMLYLLFVS